MSLNQSPSEDGSVVVTMTSLKNGRLSKDDHVIVWGSLRSVKKENQILNYVEASDISVMSNVITEGNHGFAK